MFNWYYMRSRSSLTAKRVKTDPAFTKLMLHADLMKIASPIASKVYRMIPASRRRGGFFNKLVSEVTRWLKYGWQIEEIADYLLKEYGTEANDIQEPAVTKLRESGKRRSLRRGKRSKDNLTRYVGKERKLFSLIAYQYRERKFRKEYNKGIETYPWSDYVKVKSERIPVNK